MAKTRMTEEKRKSLLKHMLDVYDAKHAHKLDKVKAKALEAVTVAIRKKYPESDMVILRKYGLNQHDHCLTFTNLDTGQVFGATLCDPYIYPDNGVGVKNPEVKNLPDIPRNRGCGSKDVFAVNATQQKAIEKFTAESEKAKEERKKKLVEYRSFLAVCKNVEEVEEVLPFTEEMKKRYFSGAPLVAANPELIDQIRKEFAA